MAVSIQQAASNALGTFLSGKLTGIPVISQWPSFSKSLPDKAITIVTAGARRDTPIDRKLLKLTNNGSTDVDAVWQLAACVQPFQLDVWTHSFIELDEIVADLDIFLNYGEKGLGSGNYDIGSGVLLNLADGWESYNSTVDFFFGQPDEMDSSEANRLKTHRAIYRGDAHFMLAVPATSPRQLLINFSMFLDGDVDPTTYNTDL